MKMNTIRSTTTAYRLTVLPEDDGDQLVSIMSDKQIPIPEPGEMIDISHISGESSNLETDSVEEGDISESIYVVESRRYRYVSFDGEGEGEGDALACSVELFVSESDD